MGICSVRKAFIGSVLGLPFLNGNGVLAQNPSLWTFNEFGLASTTHITACQTLSVNVSAMESAFGSNPPYLLIATELDGRPTTTTLDSTDTQNMTWSVDHKQGTEVVLQVVNSAGRTGGTSPVYSILAGSSDCLSSSDDDSFTIRTNITDKLSTCDPWGVRLSGGTPPYDVSFLAPGSPAVTNVTTLGNDDAYTYINRAAPNDMLIVSASDSKGKWATGTPHVTTQGSTDVKCGDAVSSSGNSSDLDSTSSSPSPEVSPAPSGGGTNTTAIIAGVVVPISVLLILFAIWFLLRRKKRNAKSEETARSAVPYGAELGNIKGPGDDALEGYITHSITMNEEPGSDVIVIGSQTGKHSTIRERFQESDSSQSPLPTSIPSSSSTTYPPAGQSRVIPSTKAQQAGFYAENFGSVNPGSPSDGSEPTERPQQASSSQSRPPAELTRRPSEQVFQHTDVADTEMVELPPPYVGDRPAINLEQLAREHEEERQEERA